MSFIGIDLGATFIKGAILDTEIGQLRTVRRIPFPIFSNKEGYIREVATRQILISVISLLDDLLTLEPNCNGLVICGQMHGLVLCDSHGKAISPFISWQDQRVLSQESTLGITWYELLCQKLEGIDFAFLGNELRPGLPLSQLFYLKQNNQLPTNAFPTSLADFILANLCNSSPMTEATNAEAHGFFDVNHGHWDINTIERLDLGDIPLPEIVKVGTQCGKYRYKDKDIPCYVAIGDQQASLLGSGLLFSELSLNIATGSQVSMLTSKIEIGNFQTRPFFDGNYLKTITHIPAGRSLNALMGLLIEYSPEKKIDDPSLWQYLNEQAGKTERTNIEVALTFFNSPLGNEGYISHIHESELTIGNLFRAAFENMAANYYLCACRLSQQNEWDSLLFTGGLINKLTTLQSAIEKRFNKVPVRVNSIEEDALTGLLILAYSIVHHSTLEIASQKILSQKH